MPVKAGLSGRANGVMIATETGKATGFSLELKQDRGILFVGPMEPVYEGPSRRRALPAITICP